MNAKIIILSLIVCLMVYIFGTRVLISTVQEQSNKKAQLIKDIKATDSAVDSLNKINTQLQQKAEDVNLISLALPSDEGIPELLVMLESLYQTKGFKVTSISLGTAGTNVAEVPTSITGSSSFEELFNIFNAVQNNIRPARVKSFTASGNVDQSGAIQISSSFSLSFPYTSTSLKTDESTAESAIGGSK